METTTHMAEEATNEAILFSTPFGYLLPIAAHRPECLLEPSHRTVEGLCALGDAMADTATSEKPAEEDKDKCCCPEPTVDGPLPKSDSDIPSIFTYFGQFIDHDLTIRTDQDTTVSVIKDKDRIQPVDPKKVAADLLNGRRPFLDLDSVYGDGPSLVENIKGLRPSHTESDKLYDSDLLLKENPINKAGGLDIPRVGIDGLIADERNNENTIISQIQAAMIAFHNKVAGNVPGSSDAEKFVKARQLVRWTYQYVVVHQYLTAVCDPNIVYDTLLNGPRLYGPGSGRPLYMPLEFSAAGFRFGHSMIRPFYNLNATAAEIANGTKETKNVMDLLLPSQNSLNFADGAIKPELQIKWENFLEGGANKARKIDPFIARDLFDLPESTRMLSDILRHLARSNLLRGYSLSLPTAQAVAKAFGISALSGIDLVRETETAPNGKPSGMKDILRDYGFTERTPLWFYLLVEAKAHHGGNRLGELGSRLICETIIGVLKADPNSYLNNCCHGDLKDAFGPYSASENQGGRPSGGVKLPGRSKAVGSIEAILDYTGIAKFPDPAPASAS